MTQTIETKDTYRHPKTLKKDFKNDDEPAALNTSDNKIVFQEVGERGLTGFETTGYFSLSDASIGEMEKVINQVSKKLIGKELKSNDNEKLKELAELLVMELEIAAARTDSISNVPAFLTEHLRRRLLGKSDVYPASKTSDVNPIEEKPSVDNLDNTAETYQAEPLTEQARKTVLKTMREYVGKGQREFVMSLRDTYTVEDWKWLSENLADEAVENDQKIADAASKNSKIRKAKKLNKGF